MKWTIGAAVPATALYVAIGVDVRPHVEYVPEVVMENTPLPLPPADAYGLPMSGYVLREGVVKRSNALALMRSVGLELDAAPS